MRHLSATDNGVVYYGGYTVDIPQPTEFDDFAVAEAGALITAARTPMRFGGEGLKHCTGRKFNVNSNGILVRNGDNFPGNKAGVSTQAEALLTMLVEKDV